MLQENRSSKNTLLFRQLKQLNVLVLYVTAVHKQQGLNFVDRAVWKSLQTSLLIFCLAKCTADSLVLSMLTIYNHESASVLTLILTRITS